MCLVPNHEVAGTESASPWHSRHIRRRLIRALCHLALSLSHPLVAMFLV